MDTLLGSLAVLAGVLVAGTYYRQARRASYMVLREAAAFRLRLVVLATLLVAAVTVAQRLL